MSSMKVEKVVEALYDHMRNRLPNDLKESGCPAVRCIENVLVAVKSENNKQVALELGMVDCGEWECPCKK